MKTYTTEIHLRLIDSHGPLFEGWLVGAQNCYPAPQKFAMTSEQAARWCAEVEEAAKRWRGLGNARIQTKRVLDVF